MKTCSPAAGLMLALCMTLAPGAIWAQGEADQITPGPRNAKTIGSWTLRCGLQEGQSEECEMFQRKLDADTRQVVVHAGVGRLTSPDAYGMLIILPLGISLPPGVFLKFDEEEPKRVSVERCDQNGCRIEIILEEELLAKLKAGKQMVVIFHTYQSSGQREPVGVPISLDGFTAAFKEITQ